MAKPRKKLVKTKKKKWYLIVTPKFMGEKPIGETFLDVMDSAVGRSITVNLMQLSGDVKRQSANIQFEISGIKDNKLTTKIIGYSFSPSSIKRLVRRRITRVDDSILVRSKDKKLVRIKPLLLTRGKVSRAVEQNMRAKLRQELIKSVSNTEFETLFNLILKYQLQRELRDRLSKVYPIKNLEIRVLKEEKSERKVIEPAVKKEEKVEEQAKEVKVEVKEEIKTEKETKEKVEETKVEKPVEEKEEKPKETKKDKKPVKK
jgi:small subunit ribosomal protein S3Ae